MWGVSAILPSAPIRTVEFESSSVLVIPRHGDNHEFPPHLVNYRANLAALKELGAEAVVALNTVGVVSDDGRTVTPFDLSPEQAARGVLGLLEADSNLRPLD